MSWIALRGRCRRCKAPISPRYPAVELLTALLFVGLALVEPLGARLVAHWALAAALVAVTFIDLEHQIIPNSITFPIPGNDDAIRAIKLFVESAAAAVDTGKMSVAHAVADSTDEFVELDGNDTARPVRKKPKKTAEKVTLKKAAPKPAATGETAAEAEPVDKTEADDAGTEAESVARTEAGED